MFQLLKQEGHARRGRFTCAHGTVETPAFMNVATQAAIKGGLSAEDLETVGCQMALSNTYHLHLRPTEQVVNAMGGLHGFMGWKGPALTDSGGFQVFSLASLRKMTEEGVHFASHIDGAAVFLSPERSVQIQWALGADVAMAFDECVANPSERAYVNASAKRTYRWLERCQQEHARLKAQPGGVNQGQQLFGINQGGVYADLRAEHMKQIAQLDLDGYAIGGLAVGEETEVMYEIIEVVEPHMPKDKIRYLMGVGTPSNLIEGVHRGVDLFDCVMPARNARHGKLFTKDGSVNIKNEKYKLDPKPIDPHCSCPTCQKYSRSYLRHLFKAGEMLGMRLAVMHNLYFYNNLMHEIRLAIEEDRFDTYRREWSPRLEQKA